MRHNLNDLKFYMEIEFNGGTTKTNLVSEKTYQKMVTLHKQGNRFVVGNNPYPGATVYGCARKDAVKVSQVNHRLHGKCIRTIWAVRGKPLAGKVTLSNDFHNTEVTVIPKDGILSVRQVKRAYKALCGMGDCICSGELGTRGPQDFGIEFEPTYSFRDGRLTGAVRCDD